MVYTDAERKRMRQGGAFVYQGAGQRQPDDAPPEQVKCKQHAIAMQRWNLHKRIALGIISILIVANNYQSVQASLPSVAYSVFLMDFLMGALVFNVVAFISCARHP